MILFSWISCYHTLCFQCITIILITFHGLKITREKSEIYTPQKFVRIQYVEMTYDLLSENLASVTVRGEILVG